MSAKDGKCEDLPPVAAQARRFDKARSAQSHARMEDYAELISDLIAAQGEARPTDIARRLGVSHATAIKFLARMKQAGADLAEKTRRRHRLVVDLLVAVGVPGEVAEVDAEGMEHHVSDAALAAFARFLAKA
jgi:DtxR family manganese transport transcriptional regulator